MGVTGAALAPKTSTRDTIRVMTIRNLMEGVMNRQDRAVLREFAHAYEDGDRALARRIIVANQNLWVFGGSTGDYYWEARNRLERSIQGP